LSQDGEILLHRTMKAAPEPFLKAIAPYRQGLVVAVACIFTWYGLADLCAQEGMAFVLGHALYMKAIHGGKAKNDKIDAHKLAQLLRGGMLPQAYVYPAQMRATRDLLRRRTHLMRQRAALLAHVQNTTSQSNLPELGKKIAYKANRDGVAERFADAAVQKSIAVDLALIT
jgi:transposase